MARPVLQPTSGIVSTAVAEFRVWSNDDELIAAGAYPYQVAGPVYWFRWLAPGQYDTSRVDLEVVRAAVANHKNDPRPLMIDIEEFDLEKDRENAIRNLNLAADPWKATERNIGWYGILPNHVGHYWTCASYVADPTPRRVEAYQQWQARNDDNYHALHGNKLQFFCPSCYAFYKPGQPGYGSWKDSAKGLLDEAVRLAGRRPVYPFIWPLYHSSSQGGSTPIGLTDWAAMVDYLVARGDIAGLVIWSPAGALDGWREPVRKTIGKVIRI